MANRWRNNRNSDRLLFSWAPKSLQMVSEAMKLKDAGSLEGKLWPASGSFPMSQFFTSSGQSIGASVSASVLPVNIQKWFPLRLTGLISLQSKGLSRVFSNTQFKSTNSSALSFLYGPTLTSIRDCWKNHSFECMDLCWKRLLLWVKAQSIL